MGKAKSPRASPFLLQWHPEVSYPRELDCLVRPIIAHTPVSSYGPFGLCLVHEQINRGMQSLEKPERTKGHSKRQVTDSPCQVWDPRMYT